MEAVAGGQWKVRLGREVIVKSSEDVNVMPWPQDLASGVIGPGRGPATNLSHNQNRKQTGAVIAQLRQGSFDRIFPSEREITPTVSNKTDEGPPNHCLVFFPTLSPSPSTVQHNAPRPQASPHIFSNSCPLPQATVICPPCLRPANTDARASLHHPETATSPPLTPEVPAKDDAPQGEPETQSFTEAC